MAAGASPVVAQAVWKRLSALSEALTGLVRYHPAPDHPMLLLTVIDTYELSLLPASHPGAAIMLEPSEKVPSHMLREQLPLPACTSTTVLPAARRLAMEFSDIDMA